MTTAVLLTIAEAACVSRRHPQTIRSWCRSGELPHQQRRRGGPIHIWESDLLQFLTSMTTST